MARDEAAILARFMSCVRAVSAEQLRRYARIPQVGVVELDVAELPFWQQMTHILVANDEIEINLKSHFMFDDVTGIARNKVPVDHLTREQTIDFMKEFCNLVAGKTKSLLEAAGLTVGQSLPFSIQGYNEIFYPEQLRRGLLAAWKLETDVGTLVCSTTVIPRLPAILDNLARVEFESEEGPKSGVLELF